MKYCNIIDTKLIYKNFYSTDVFKLIRYVYAWWRDSIWCSTCPRPWISDWTSQSTWNKWVKTFMYNEYIHLSFEWE